MGFFQIISYLGNAFSKQKIPHQVLEEVEEGDYESPIDHSVHPDYADMALCEFTETGGVRLVKTDSKEYRKEMKRVEKKKEYKDKKEHYENRDSEQSWFFRDIGFQMVQFYFMDATPGNFLVVKEKQVLKLYFIYLDGREKVVQIMHKKKEKKNTYSYKFYKMKKWENCLMDLITYAQTHEIKHFGMKLTQGVDPNKRKYC